MTRPANQQNITAIKKILLLQMVLIIVITGAIYISFGIATAQASFLGAVIAWLGHYVFTIFSFKYVGATAKNKIVSSMYKGQMIKWLLSIFLFVVAIKLLKTEKISWLVCSFALAQMSNWFFLIIKK